MRNSLFIGIGVALSAAVMADTPISVKGSDDSRSGSERCVISFSAAQQDVCQRTVTMANPDLAVLGEVQRYEKSPLRLIKFDGPITNQRRAAVEAKYHILGYAPHYAYIVRAKANVKPGTIEGEVWSGPFLPAFKVDLNVANELKGEKIAEAAGVTELVVSMHESADRSAVEAAVMSAPGLEFVSTITAGPDTRVVARFDRASLRAAVEQLAADPSVAAIGFRWPMTTRNSQADWLHQSNVNSPSPLRPVFDRGLYGCGQIVGELDTGLHIANCAFNDAAQAPPVNNCTSGASCPTITTPNNAARKVIAYYKWSGLTGNTPTDPHGHGTHVAGSILGQNPATPIDCTNFTSPGGHTDLDGTAPGAKLVMQETGSNLAYLNNHGGNPYHAANTAYQNGARLHSNSWGGGCTDQFGACVSGCTVTYDAQARDADNVTRDRDDLVLLFAAGNDASACPAGNNVGSPGNAKNVITVGATSRGTAANGMASFSSRGPTIDSRTKPDITAQGSSIVSAGRNACGTATMSGTSMATPTAAGLAALVREYLQRGFYPTGQKVAANAIANPSGALVKAILIAGAMPMTGTGAGTSPGQSQGWGRILLDDSLYFSGDTSKLYIHDATTGLSTGGLDTHTLTVSAGSPLNIALTWTDAAAAVNANPALVNGLRLEVVAPNGDVWTQKLPSGVSPSNANPSQSTTTTNYDNRNNVHRISFANPAAGTYTVRVRGVNVPSGPQKYAVAATGNFGGGGGNVPPVANFSSSASGLVVNFTDSSTDSDGTITARSWNFGDGSSSTATNPSHTYAAAGTYTVTLTVTDDDGATHTKTASVTVTSGPGNVAPVANFTSTTSGLTANFTDTSTDSDGTIASRSWNFGDGSTSTATNPSKTYASAGTYTVTLTVTDDDGATNTKSGSVTVTAPPDTVLQNGVPKTGLSIAQGAGLSFTMVVPAGASGLKFVTSGGTGDADLYVKFGSAASTTSYDCRSIGSTNAETCNIATAQAGTYHVFIHGYSAVSGLSLTGSFNTGGNVLQNGVPRTGLSGSTGNTQVFTLAVPAGATNLRFVINGGSGDADMYVRFNAAPTTTTYDCRPYLPGNSETCNISPAQAGTYYVMVRAYSTYSGLSLTGSYTP
ncbi:PKD domain-containing protein [Tahibacter amnicola]|uniref:PKD domain-containing protein n=1 Tax=Tahibacter amnicola TaxID=2976241 RepID=UPI00249DAE26|nr:PKD domain-containing protein [Tahibacter amnicola]